MDKTIQELIKETAGRYGLGYDLNSDYPTVLQEDGTVKKITFEDMNNIFNVSPPEDTWTRYKNEVNWSNDITVSINLKNKFSNEIEIPFVA